MECAPRSCGPPACKRGPGNRPGLCPGSQAPDQGEASRYVNVVKIASLKALGVPDGLTEARTTLYAAHPRAARGIVR